MAIHDCSERTIATLTKLACELNLPVEAFFREPVENEAEDLLALLRLWSAIPDSQGRHRVLSVARQEAERSDRK